MKEIREELIRGLPNLPGVYLFKDERGEVLYVGKAKDLRSRVRSYFRAQGELRPAALHCGRKVCQVDTFVTDTEKEALILEDNLIKRFQPPLNIRLRDDKTFLSIRIHPGEEFPRLSMVRRTKRDGALFFGPYASAKALRRTLKLLCLFFPIRTCKDSVFRNRSRPCLLYELKRCSGPCCGLISREEYQKLVEGMILFLRGKKEGILKTLKREMEREAGKLDFERAAELRDRIIALEKTMEPQKMVLPSGGNADVIGLFTEGEIRALSVLFIRDGQLLSSREFLFSTPLDPSILLSSFLSQFYREGRYIPEKIQVSHLPEEKELLERGLSERRGSKLKIHTPRSGRARGLVELAVKNAQAQLKAEESVRERGELYGGLEKLGRLMGLGRIPRRIEVYDISETAGKEIVGVRVVFHEGKDKKDEYRRYRLRTVSGPDDFASLREVLSRRFRTQEAGESLPDILLVDGGRGQLSVALEVLEKNGIEGVAVAALAKRRFKGGSREPGFKTPERLFLAGERESRVLQEGSPECTLLQRMRDEAHRFAVTYHRKIREKGVLASPLEEIPGVGKTRCRILLRHFRGMEGIKRASLNDLKGTPGLPLRTAEQVFEFFHPGESQKNNEK